MKVKDLLTIEAENTHQVILFKEGLFWRAYNLSAFLFTKYIQDFKVKKRFYKVANKELVYLGFPNTNLVKILEKATTYFEVNERQDKKVVLVLKEGKEIDIKSYQKWFDSFEIKIPQTINSNCKKILQKISGFPIMTKTPMESQLFLVSLQKEVNGII